jgi:hypothetical protein
VPAFAHLFLPVPLQLLHACGLLLFNANGESTVFISAAWRFAADAGIVEFGRIQHSLSMRVTV